jgi:hypothetical protein
MVGRPIRAFNAADQSGCGGDCDEPRRALRRTRLLRPCAVRCSCSSPRPVVCCLASRRAPSIVARAGHAARCGQCSDRGLDASKRSQIASNHCLRRPADAGSTTGPNVTPPDVTVSARRPWSSTCDCLPRSASQRSASLARARSCRSLIWINANSYGYCSPVCLNLCRTSCEDMVHRRNSDHIDKQEDVQGEVHEETV